MMYSCSEGGRGVGGVELIVCLSFVMSVIFTYESSEDVADCVCVCVCVYVLQLIP